MKVSAGSLCIVLAACSMYGTQGRKDSALSPKASPRSPTSSLLSHGLHRIKLPAEEQNSEPRGEGASDSLDVPRIVGGTEAKRHEFPWVVSYQFYECTNTAYEHKCGGSIIDQWWVLTAAHCVFWTTEKGIIVAGEHNIMQDDGDEQTRKVETVIVHPKYNSSSLDNDIALLKLEEPLKLDGKNVSTISLPTSSATFTGNCLATGWGFTKADFYEPSSVLMKVELPIITDKKCKFIYKQSCYPVSDTHICVGDGVKNVCRGDSGGGLICKGANNQDYVAGVTSRGVICARPDIPSVFMEVSWFVDWINEVMQSSKS